MKIPTDRIKTQKKEINSIIKEFFQDQFGILLIFIGGIPVFIEYFNLIPPPILIKGYAKVVTIIILLICSLAIMYIYSERRYLAKNIKKEAIIFGLLMIAIGAVSFSLFMLSSIKLNPCYPNDVQNCTTPLPITISFNINNIFLSFIIFTFAGQIFIYFYFLLKNIIDNYEATKINKNIPTKFKTTSFPYIFIIIIIVTIIIVFDEYIIVNQQPFYKSNLAFELPSTTFKILNLVTFLISYPFILIGSIIILNLIYVPYELKHNFYQNINWLSDEFYEYVRSITESLVEFEEWNDRERKAITQTYLLSNEGEIEEKHYHFERRKQLFYWKVMNSKLKFYSERIKELSNEGEPVLYASGGLTDDILDFVKIESIKSFNAVSYKDLFFWVQRGQEYLKQNKELIRDGIVIKRIFLIDGIQDFQIDNNDDFIKIIKMLFEQIEYGIIVYIMNKDVIYDFNYNNMVTLPDFGVYENFAVSFFDKPMKVGGRSLRMEFKEETIKNYTQYFKDILNKREIGGYQDYVKKEILKEEHEKVFEQLNCILKDEKNKYKKFFEYVWKDSKDEISIDDIDNDDEKKGLLYEFQYTFIATLRVLTFTHYLLHHVFDEVSLKEKEGEEKKKKDLIKNVFNAYIQWKYTFHKHRIQEITKLKEDIRLKKRTYEDLENLKLDFESNKTFEIRGFQNDKFEKDKPLENKSLETEKLLKEIEQIIFNNLEEYIISYKSSSVKEEKEMVKYLKEMGYFRDSTNSIQPLKTSSNSDLGFEDSTRQ